MNPSSPSAKNNSSDANNDNYEISPTASGSPLSPIPDPQPPPTPKFLSRALMKCQSFPCVAVVFALTLTWGLISSHAADETVLDTATIEAITGLKGVSNQTEGTF